MTSSSTLILFKFDFVFHPFCFATAKFGVLHCFIIFKLGNRNLYLRKAFLYDIFIILFTKSMQSIFNLKTHSWRMELSFDHWVPYHLISFVRIFHHFYQNFYAFNTFLVKYVKVKFRNIRSFSVLHRWLSWVVPKLVVSDFIHQPEVTRDSLFHMSIITHHLL